ncbi:hypothetical protein [Xingshan nematode virus 1]|uniref:hypothetical protein n=1 Tax=Xingshan nematode virus 1 TaxID=1923760 RepID=UPI00090C5B9B|nr:hypothetical protein [Xingshan nematode virus 1]APG77851.1 hypothetical protein [Xingshan nematode virus 1]
MALIDPLLVDAKAKDFVEQRLGSHEPNPIRDFMEHACADKLKEEFRKMERIRTIKVMIPEDLSNEQENKLVRMYPSLNLTFTKKSSNSHCFAAASRKCENAILLQLIGYDHIVAMSTDGRDDYATDIGGNFYRHLADMNKGIHCCCPMLDDRDVQRFVQRREALKKLYFSEIKRMKIRSDDPKISDDRDEEFRKFLNDTKNRTFDNKWVCLRKAQECTRTARYGIMLHSNYDISLRELGDIMTKKNMSEIYGSFIFDDRILYMNEGYIECLECYFSYSIDKKYLEFTFKNDSALIYRHRVRTYMAYVMVSTFVDSTGLNRFILELLENRNGIQFFRVTALPYRVSVKFSPLVHRVWFKSLEGKLKVTFPVADQTALRKGCVSAIIKEKVMYLDKELIDKIMGHAMTATENKFKPVEILSFIQAYTHRIFFGEDVTSRMPSMTFNEKYHLSLAIYVEVYKRKYDVGKMVQFVLECVQYDRDLLQKGFFRRIFSSSKPLYSAFKAALPVSCFSSLMGPFYLMAFNVSCSPVDGYKFIEEVPKYISTESVGFCQYAVSAVKNKIVGLIDEAFDQFTCAPRFEHLQILPVFYPKVVVPELIWEPEKTIKSILADNFCVDATVVRKDVDRDAEVAVECKISGGVGVVRSLCEKFKSFVKGKTVVEKGVNNRSDAVSDITEKSIMGVDFGECRRIVKTRKDIIALANFVATNVDEKDYRRYVDDNTRMDYNRADTLFISRAEYKLKEILELYVPGEVGNALDLCAGPGGFTKTLIKKVVNKVFMHYYRDADVGCTVDFDKLRRCDLFGKLCVLDLENTDLLCETTGEVIVQKIIESKVGIDLVTADGALHNDVIDKEVENFYLIKAQIAVVEKVLADGGVAVIKTFGFYGHETLDMLGTFLSKFVKYHVHRSSYVTPFSMEHYIVALRYCSTADVKSVAFKNRKVFVYRDLKSIMNNFDIALRKEYVRFLSGLVGSDKVEGILEGSTIYSVDNNTEVESSSCVLTTDLEFVTCEERTGKLSVVTDSTIGDDETKSDFVDESVENNCSAESRAILDLAVFGGDDNCFVDDDLGVLAFSGESCPLSNCFVSELTIDDGVAKRVFTTVERAVIYLASDAYGCGSFGLELLKEKDDRVLRKKWKKFLSKKGEELWKNRREDIVKRVLDCRFKCCEFARILQGTSGWHLVNATVDDHWGAGVTLKKFRSDGRVSYLGRNVYGKLLMDVRRSLLLDNDFGSTKKQEIVPQIDLASCVYSVKADGSCLYYALMSGDDNDADCLRAKLLDVYEKDKDYYNGIGINDEDLRQELAGWGGRNVINLFSDHYKAKISVDSIDGECVCSFGDSLSRPSYVLRLRYDGSHYYITSVCGDDFGFGGGFVSRRFNYNSIDVVEIYRSLDCLLRKNFTSFQNFVSYILGSTVLSYADAISAIDLSQHNFYNAVARYCGFHCECRGVALSSLIEYLGSRDYRKTLYLLVSIYDLDFERFQNLISAMGLCCMLLNLPWLLNKNFAILILAFGTGVEQNVSLLEMINLAKDHIRDCSCCARISSVRNVDGIWYNRLSATYYCCGGDSACRMVYRTTVLPRVDRIFVFDALDCDVSYAESEIIERCDGYHVPVRVVDNEVIDDFDYNGYRHILRRHFEKCGSVSVVGVRHSDILSFKILIDVMKEFVYLIYVEVKGIENFAGSGRGTDANFRPDFRQSITSDDVMINAMIEAREMWRVSNQMIIDNVRNLHERCSLMMSGVSGRIEFVNNKPDYGMIDLTTGKFLIKPREGVGRYSRGYNGEILVDIERCYDGDRLVPGVMCGRVSVTKDMRIVNSDLIYNNVMNIELSDFTYDGVTFVLIEGVPGCGKSTYILKNHEFSVDDCKHVVLTATKETAEDMRRRAADMYGVSSDLAIMKKRYRTVDSYLVHSNCRNENGEIDTLWIDEGLMKHFGEILWCVYLSGATKVFICGDRAQIPFINRNGSIRLRYSLLDSIKDRLQIKFLDKSYRCPVDVVAHLNNLKVYPRKVITENKNFLSMRIMNINGLSDVPFCDWRNAVILTFTQQEKNDVLIHIVKIGMVAEWDKRVFTVHEFQGKQTAEVLLIRLQVKPISIYDSVSHQLVAFTRHTSRFIYCTAKNDMLATMIRKTFSQNELKSCVVDGLRGGGNVEDCVNYPLVDTIAVDAYILDYLKQNKMLRELVIDHAGTNVIPFRNCIRKIDVKEIMIPYISPLEVGNPIAALQEFIDVVFPGASSVDKTFDNEIFEMDLMTVPRDRVIVTMPHVPRLPRYQCLTSRLRTNCPDSVVTTQKQLVKAYYQRNGNVPDLYGLNNDDLLVRQMVERFVETYIADLRIFNKYRDEPVNINVACIEEWIATQPVKVFEMLSKDADINIFVKDLRIYNFCLKRLPKPKLEVGNENKYVSPQTIAHHCKKINAIFCPIVREIKKRLISVLKCDKLIYTDMAVEDLEKLMNFRLPVELYDKFKYMLEVDFSKYDKSQGRIALKFELAILRLLGFPEELLATWSVMHVYTRLWSPLVKFKAEICFQRKSGDAMTFFGNTLFLMAVLAHSFDLNREFCMFSGDDSIIFSRTKLDSGISVANLAFKFNLESKLLHYKVPYFCSKFLIWTPEGSWKIIPDPVKLVVKLGRNDLVNWDHRDEYRVSLRDTVKAFENAYYYPFLSAAVSDRYQLYAADFTYYFSAIVSLVNNDKAFDNLYFLEEGHYLNPYRVVLPSLEF